MGEKNRLNVLNLTRDCERIYTNVNKCQIVNLPANKSVMSIVFLKEGESLDVAMRRLKSKIDTEGTMDEVRRIQAFETPKERRQRKLRNRLRREKIARLNRQSSQGSSSKNYGRD